MIDIYEMVAIFQFFIMANTDILFQLTHGKLQTQTIGGVSNLKFKHMIVIYEMVAIIDFFHNGRCSYSISINTLKTRDPNFVGVSYLKFFVRSIFMKWWPFFNFFIMANTDISFPKCKFSIGSVSPSPHHFIFGSVSTF